MRVRILPASLLFVCLLFSQPVLAESILGALDALGNEANRVNEEVLDNLGRNSFESQMSNYRRMEAARVREMSAVTGVDQNVIRQLRQEGNTWEQIAAKYGVDLATLPAPESLGQ